MPILRGRSIVLLTYAALTVHGFASGGSGFLLLFALQLDLVSLIILYGYRPRIARGSEQPSSVSILIGSIPILIINFVLAVALGAALGEYPTGGDFLDGPKAVWRDAMIALTIAYLVAVALDGILFRRDKAFWEGIVSRMAIKGTVLAFLGYIGFGLLVWLGQENGHWVIPCLAMIRMALEFVLQPEPEASANANDRGR